MEGPSPSPSDRGEGMFACRRVLSLFSELLCCAPGVCHVGGASPTPPRRRHRRCREPFALRCGHRGRRGDGSAVRGGWPGVAGVGPRPRTPARALEPSLSLRHVAGRAGRRIVCANWPNPVPAPRFGQSLAQSGGSHRGMQLVAEAAEIEFGSGLPALSGLPDEVRSDGVAFGRSPQPSRRQLSTKVNGHQRSGHAQDVSYLDIAPSGVWSGTRSLPRQLRSLSCMLHGCMSSNP